MLTGINSVRIMYVILFFEAGDLKTCTSPWFRHRFKQPSQPSIRSRGRQRGYADLFTSTLDRRDC